MQTYTAFIKHQPKIAKLNNVSLIFYSILFLQAIHRREGTLCGFICIRENIILEMPYEQNQYPYRGTQSEFGYTLLLCNVKYFMSHLIYIFLIQ